MADAVIRLIRKLFTSSRTLNGQRLRSANAFFHAVDADGNGIISLEEWKDGLLQLGMDISDKELTRSLAALDASDDGQLQLREFMVAYEREHAATSIQAVHRGRQYRRT